MYKKMLVLLDGSQLAEIVFPYVTEVAGRLGIDVTLLHVYAPGSREFAPMYKAYIDRSADALQNRARQVQNNTGKPIAKAVEVRGEIKMGYHADEILRYVDDNNVDMVMMASHGRSGGTRWSMGSVADKILRASKVPVWLVHAGDEKALPYDKWPTRTLLVPLSGTDVSATVLPHALTLAKQSGAVAQVVLLQIIEPPVTPSYYSPEITGVPFNWGQFVEQEITRGKKNATEYLAGIEKQFKEAGIPATSIVGTGTPAEEIINFATKNPYTIIVMATHGRSGFRRLVYGSVAESVLFGTVNPIVLVKPQ
ncbi:MAG: universal stress protein [Dehalococcoidales bacterium]|nr:universal stress protein [Dehalococcoidales bacterium]